MNTTNQRFFQIFSLVLLGVGAFALINANSSWVNANTEETSQTVSASNTYSRKRHTISLTLNELDDLKVVEGQRVSVGDLISDRTTARAKLLAKKQRLEAAVVKASLPLNQLKPVPEPKFQQELVALKQAKFELNSIVAKINNFDREFNFKDPWLSTIFESEKVQKLADLKQQELEASIRVEKAIAAIDEAKLNYQKQQYEHSLKVSDYQTKLQEQQNQIVSLQAQLDKVNEDIDKLTSVYSPYQGKVRRVKILGQNERSINVEVTLDIRDGK